MSTKDRTKDPTRLLPKRDPEGSYVRKKIAKRRVGQRRCQCGEDRPEALIADSAWCAECQRRCQGKATEDQDHLAGKANDSTAFPVPVNDHRAELSTAQHEWPKETLQNTDGSPLLRAAGCVRGFIDRAIYFIKKMLGWVPDMLETLHALLVKLLGPRYWVGTALAEFEPK